MDDGEDDGEDDGDDEYLDKLMNDSIFSRLRFWHALRTKMHNRNGCK